jgi:hypothetical protein
MNALNKNGKEALKKVFLAFILALAVHSPMRAAVVYFDTDNPFVIPSETILVSIFSTVETDSIRMDKISDDVGGTASNLYLNPNYDTPLNPGIIVNTGGILIEGVSTGITPAFPAVSGVLYSFDYTVPLVSSGTVITIFANPSNGAVNEVRAKIGPGLTAITPESLSITVVPEPAALLVFAGGGFILLRLRRKK